MRGDQPLVEISRGIIWALQGWGINSDEGDDWRKDRKEQDDLPSCRDQRRPTGRDQFGKVPIPSEMTIGCTGGAEQIRLPTFSLTWPFLSLYSSHQKGNSCQTSGVRGFRGSKALCSPVYFGECHTDRSAIRLLIREAQDGLYSLYRENP